MALNLRRQGVYAENLPTKKTLGIAASDFLIGSIVGQFERSYDVAMLCNNITEFKERFGTDFSSSYYGYEAVEGFFANAAGTTGKLYVKAHVGYDGSAIDGVVASAQPVDGDTNPVIKIEAAFRSDLEYGIGGNRTGYQIENGTRTTTAIMTATTKDDTFIYTDSVSDIKVGDIIKVVSTGGGGATVHKKVTAVEETSKKVSFTGAFHVTANPEIDDVVTVLGFKLKIYRKNIKGIVTEVNTDLGDKWVSTESENTDYYIETVFNEVSDWVKITRLSTTPSVPENTFPVDVATTTYLTSGSDGTAPTTSAHWSRDLIKLDNLPVRFIGNPESTDETIQKAGETYCKGRTTDEPKWITNIAKDRTKAQLITIGQNFQRSDEVLSVIVAEWLKITDPFNDNINAPAREIPNIGHVMGSWIRSIGINGIHYVPAIKSNALKGILGIVNENLGNIGDQDRTDILNAGVNIIQFVQGHGYIIRNLNTPCTALDYVFANAGLMKSYIKVSIVDSLQTSENEPNSFDRIKAGRDAIVTFMLNLALKGSTGSVPIGETFGQIEGQDVLDTFEVQGDLVNNTAASIAAGERNYDGWFQRPAPTGSIRVRWGILLS